MVVKLLEMALQKEGETIWKDESNLDFGAADLKQSVETALLRTRVVIICLGLHDLERCSHKEDFLRWEIDTARRLETEEKVKVVILMHGVTKWEELIPDKLKKTSWGKELMVYFGSHLLISFDMNAFGTMIAKLRSIPDSRRRAPKLVCSSVMTLMINV
jgi:hypothetical protein